jgi:RNA polymerase sigma-70 factor, ECF subfamily
MQRDDEVGLGIIELLPRLRRFSYALTGDLVEGDDLVQETCLRALARADQWQPGTRLDSWVFTIARNIWLDQKRASRTRGMVVEFDSAPEIAGMDGRDVVERRLTLSAVLKAMAALPDDQQVLVALICIDGLSYQEAAEILEIPKGTVMSRLARARRFIHARAVA